MHVGIIQLRPAKAYPLRCVVLQVLLQGDVRGCVRCVFVVTSSFALAGGLWPAVLGCTSTACSSPLGLEIAPMLGLEGV